MMPKVLVVDKEKFWRTMAQVALESEGYRVDLLDDYSGLQNALAKCPDVILLGFSIIEQREEEIIRLARRTCPEAIVLVLSTSRLISQSIERRLLRLGVADIVGRPGDGRDLARLVRAELKAKREEMASLSSYARFRLQGAK